MAKLTENLDWHKVAEAGELPEGRVKTVTAGAKSMALTHIDGVFTAMDNRCPHQGGPLGEGSIETGKDGKCWLRCPWHGWDFDPQTGKPPGGHADSGQKLYPVEVRADGVYLGLEKPPPRARTVSDVMAETMCNWGIRSVFGMVGHSNLGFADALRALESAGKLRYFGIRHEGAAAFACSGYAKASGLPAACLSIAGPGATNLLTGLWDAKVDRAPMLALTGQIDVQVFGPGAFQEVDLAAAFAAVADFSQTALPGSKHAELMNLACKNAVVNRLPAHLIFPDNVQTVPAEDAAPGSPDGRLAARAIAPPADAIAGALALIKKHRRPIIIAGYGARDSMREVIALAETLHAPVLTTFKGKGQIADAHALAAGVLGRSGTPMASWFMNECDLILAFGSSFSNHTGITQKRAVIQVDFEPMALGKFHAVTLPLWGEIGVTANLLREKICANGGAKHVTDQRNEINARKEIWRREKQNRRSDDRGRGLNSARIFDALTRLLPDNAIIAVDVGNNTYSFGRYFECAGQSVLMSGYLGAIGFSFPAAMGAWAATLDCEALRGRPVVSISGDGGFGQYLAELTTAVKYNMNITHILLNNGELGKISKEQRAAEWQVWQTTLHNPNFAAYARLCGAHGERVRDADKLDAAVTKALAHKGPALVEIISDAELV